MKHHVLTRDLGSHRRRETARNLLIKVMKDQRNCTVIGTMELFRAFSVCTTSREKKKKKKTSSKMYMPTLKDPKIYKQKLLIKATCIHENYLKLHRAVSHYHEPSDNGTQARRCRRPQDVTRRATRARNTRAGPRLPRCHHDTPPACAAGRGRRPEPHTAASPHCFVCPSFEVSCIINILVKASIYL